jgi:F0F1-type ATP synthase membrane subunit b/b'
MPQFDTAYFPGQIFWLFLLFGSLYFFVNFLIAPRAKDIIDRRSSTIEENLIQSKNLTTELASLEATKQELKIALGQKIEHIRHEALKMVDLHLKQQEVEFADLARIHHENLTAKIREQIEIFKKKELENCIMLASVMIEKITNKKADRKILSEIYSSVK